MFKLFHISMLIHDDQYINYTNAKGSFSPRNNFLYVFVLQEKHVIISLHQLIHAFSWKHIVMDI